MCFTVRDEQLLGSKVMIHIHEIFSFMHSVLSLHRYLNLELNHTEFNSEQFERSNRPKDDLVHAEQQHTGHFLVPT